MSLNDTAIIANPRFKVWAARKLDKDATIELCTLKQAEHGAARVNKSLMPDEPKLKAIRKLVGEARNYHYDHTLPWEDRGGGRILPAGLFVPYQKQMDSFQAKIKLLIDEFCEPSYYQSAVEAGKKKLGQLADPWEYPSSQKVKYSFEAEIAYYPIPNPTDFRVQLGAHEVQRLKDTARIHEKDVIKRATEHLWDRLSKLAKHAHERLSDPDKSFHSSLTKNINHFNEIVQELNIGEDRFIAQIAKELAADVGDASVDDLRNDENVRGVAARGAESALDKINKQMEAFKNADSS